jgi:hypothetical protein
MKTLLLVAGGRGGSDFFQGLLDGHTQILSFPLYLKIDDNFIQILNEENPEKLAKQFINFVPEIFNSKINKFERYHRLGKNRNKHFKVSKKKFIQSFVNLNKSKKFDNFNKLKLLHYAYSISKGEILKKKKILFIHTHLVSWTQKFVREVKPINYEIIHIIRHPLASLSSPIKNWLNFDGGKGFFAKDLYFQIDLVFKGIFDLMKINKVKIIQYEYLHWKHKRVMNDFCKIYNIKFEKCLNTCTKNGLIWWGDRASRKWLTGINKKFTIKIDTNYFFKRDIHFFQFINERIIKNYKYNQLFDENKIFLNFLPMKCELLVWKNSLKHLIFDFRWKNFFTIPYFYLLRIIFINKFMDTKKKLPYSIGS